MFSGYGSRMVNYAKQYGQPWLTILFYGFTVHQITRKRWLTWQKLLQTTNRKSYTSFRLVPLVLMVLTDI